jgi:hypothetical protein
MLRNAQQDFWDSAASVLIGNEEVPILVGGKVSGRIGSTTFGAWAIRIRPGEKVIGSDRRTIIDDVSDHVEQLRWSL